MSATAAAPKIPLAVWAQAALDLHAPHTLPESAVWEFRAVTLCPKQKRLTQALIDCQMVAESRPTITTPPDVLRTFARLANLDTKALHARAAEINEGRLDALVDFEQVASLWEDELEDRKAERGGRYP